MNARSSVQRPPWWMALAAPLLGILLLMGLWAGLVALGVQ